MMKPDVYHTLGLSDQEYQNILKILKREPSPTELAMFSVEWSEHCGYLCSRKWLKLLPKRGKYKTLIGEDSGGIIIDDLAIIFKMESHNHPSQVEPKQGAATGVGGIIRDIFTAGARPIALLDSLRFGPLSHPYNKYLLAGVVDGIQFYGNCVGVPTVGGEIYFDESYSGNCLVNAMCIGIAKKDKIARARAFGKGNSIMYVGSSTGRDGIGGCSILASNEFREDEEKRPTVQIGDPFTEKCLIEATLEAINTGYVVGIKDMGAAGLTCCTSEMASAGNSGMDIDLKAVPRREENMQPWELMMSESQERMLVCVKKGKEEEVRKIFLKWDLNASVIGKVTDDGLVTIRDKGNIAAQIKAHALTKAPVYNMPYKKPTYLRELNRLKLSGISQSKDYNKVLLKLLNVPSIANKAWVYQQYDHMVQTNTVILPGSDAAVLRLPATKYGGSLLVRQAGASGGKETNKAIAATTDCNSRYCFLNPYRGAQIAIAEAARNLVCSGAHPAAVTDCLNFGNPQKPESFWQFKNCVEGIADACRVFNVAVVSGNVSFYNESPKYAINPTPAIGMIGIINDVSKTCSQNFKQAGDLIILLGKCKEELGASEYLKEVHHLVRGNAPQLDLKLEQSVQKTALHAIERGLVNSAHDCSEGGLAVALVECCISNKDNMIGATIDNLNYNIRTDALLFGESQSRIILSCNRQSIKVIEKIAKKNKTPLRIIGMTIGREFKILNGKKELINLALEYLLKEWGQFI
ncbi:MAG: phosphoribosylformylglycinamidine synthase subunit PurL [Candidatus Omnitrophota bacterium]|nr:phosphoribosylformylglycinamidine synthase subunit PurL [Candidatus Omnitrophota bacterium]